MGKSSPSAPAAPDPAATGAAQTATNVQTAVANSELNHLDTTTPWYSQDYTQPPVLNADGSVKTDSTGAPVFQTNADGTPVYNQSITLAPDQQTLLDQSSQQNIAKNNLADQYIGGAFTQMANNGLNTSNIPNLATGVSTGGIQGGFNSGGPIMYGFGGVGQPNGNIASAGQAPTQFYTPDTSGAVNQTIQSVYGQAEPMLQIQGNNLNNQLANEGVQQGSQAWNNAQIPQSNAQNNLMMQAVQAGNAEQQTLFGEAGQEGQFAQAGQAQQFGQNAQQTASGLTAQQQQYQESLASMQAANAAQQQAYGENQGEATFGNQAQTQNFTEQQQNAALQNSAASQGLSQDITERELPLNEYNAFATGTQVQPPGYSPTQPVAVNGTNLAQLYQNQFAGNQDAYNAQVGSQNSQTAGLYGLGGSAASALALALL